MRNLFIVYATCLQIVTALFILAVPEPILVARLGFFSFIFSSVLGALLMLASAIIAIHVLLKKLKYYYIFLLPQLFFMLLSGISALSFVFQGHYADGVMRPWYFIFLDQLPIVLGVVFYTLALINFERERSRLP